MTGHIDRLILERFAVEDLPAESVTGVADHVRSCAICGGYVVELERARAARMAAVPPERFLAALASRRDGTARGTATPRTFWRLAMGGVGVVAAAAAVVLFVGVPRRDQGPRDGRVKGAAAPGVLIHRKRGADVRVMGEGDRIRAGDALRFELVLPARGRVVAWLDERARRIPLTGGSDGMVLEAGDQALPGSVVIEPPCVALDLVIDVGGATARRKLTCE